MRDLWTLRTLVFLCLARLSFASVYPTQHVLSKQDLTNHHLNFSSSSPLIFHSVFGLLQQWSNTFFPNGHVIVPCQVPINTNLYHARMGNDLPPNPEWFAFDAGMSYAIAGTMQNSQMLTYKTQKTVKCIYFDGASAALDGIGKTESQMVFIYKCSSNVPQDHGFGRHNASGNATRRFPEQEYLRAENLCAYISRKGLGGSGWGYEGIVRMNAGFEMIWCNFDSPSVKLVSKLNISVPTFDTERKVALTATTGDGARAMLSAIDDLAARPSSPSRPSFDRQFWRSAILGWQASSFNNYGFFGSIPGRGEARVKLDTCGFFSFHDPSLLDQERARVASECSTLNLSASGSWSSRPHLDRHHALQMLTRRRRRQRTSNVSDADGLYMHSAVESRLRDSLKAENQCSGVDWQQTAQDIIMAYSSTLLDLSKLLGDMPAAWQNTTQALEWLTPFRELAHLPMMPFYVYPTRYEINASPKQAFSTTSQSARDAYTRCQQSYAPHPHTTMADSEVLILKSTTEVMSTICFTLLQVFLSVETIHYSISTHHDSTSSDGATQMGSSKYAREITERAIVWRNSIEELMAWLGWAEQWTACKPGCTIDEFCYIPVWPLTWMGGRSEHRLEHGSGPGPEHRPPHPRSVDSEADVYETPTRPGHRPGWGWQDQENELWNPKCVSRMDYLRGRS